MTTQHPTPETFDDYISTESATLAPPVEGAPPSSGGPGPQEVNVKRGASGRKPPMNKRRKMLLLGGIGLLAMAAVMMFGKDDLPPRVAPTASVADSLAQPPSPNPEPENSAAPGVPLTGFQDVTPAEGAMLSDASDPTLDALNAFALSGDAVPVVGEPAATDAAEVSIPVEPAAPTLPAPSPSPPRVAATETAPAPDTVTRMRIEALENDLERAQAARRAAERNQRAPVTVVAVLDDGVVVRDPRGREKVLTVGDQVK